MIDLTPLHNALSRLKEGLSRYESEPDDDQLRDGLIQRFEFTYEISHKMVKRYLREASANPESINELSFQSLIRSANEQGLLLSDWPRWAGFREMRGKTSHTYDERIALAVVGQIPDFVAEIDFLAAELSKRCVQ